MLCSTDSGGLEDQGRSRKSERGRCAEQEHSILAGMQRELREQALLEAIDVEDADEGGAGSVGDTTERLIDLHHKPSEYVRVDHLGDGVARVYGLCQMGGDREKGGHARRMYDLEAALKRGGETSLSLRRKAETKGWSS